MVSAKRQSEHQSGLPRESALAPPKKPPSDPPLRKRVEWNGLAGWREIRISRRLISSDGGSQVQREERLIGEISEPMS